MEITPGRAPFTEDEDYTPLRKPKSATNTPTHVPHGYVPQQQQQQQIQQQQIQQQHQQQHQQQQQQQQLQQQQQPLPYSHVSGGAVGYAGGPSGSSGGASFPYGATHAPMSMLSAHAKEFVLSANAKEFVPRFSGNTNAAQERLEQQQRHQQQYNQQQYQQYHQPPQQQQQRYMNGYQQQQQQQQMYSSQVNSLTGSVQERLKVSIAGGGGGGGGGGNKNISGNYYQNQNQPRHHNHNKNNHHHHHNQQQQQQQHNNHHGGHHNQHQHQQRYNQQQQHASSAQAAQQNQGSSSEVETIALDYLQTVIQCLNQNPGQFDTIATRFLTIFDGMESNQYVLSNAMEDIFQESIQNPNFRYMGAKLYNLLHMLNLKRDSLFQTLLKCKLDYHQQEVAQYMQSDQQGKVRETALFLAELYMQLRGDDSRIQLIAENIVYSLKQLLSPRGEHAADDVRCICLTLKLAGYDLTADCAAEMQEIIAQLDAITATNPGKFPVADSVIQLQRNNWGRKVSSSNSLCDPETAKPPEPLRTSDEPIFYGPDGRELTAEECAFLSGGAGGMSGSTDEEDLGDLDIDLDPEMDEETEKAYKEFCKLNANANA